MSSEEYGGIDVMSYSRDFQDARTTIDEIVDYYNMERRHSSLQYLTPLQYYR